MDKYSLMAGLVFIIGGILIIVIRLLRVKLFMSHYQMIEMERNFGRKGADIGYIIFGSIFIIIGILLII